VKTGDIVSVKVMEIDVARKRIGLSMRLDATAGKASSSAGATRSNEKFNPRLMQSNAVATPNAMMSAFAKLKK
jgi:protein Tex